MNKGLVIQGKSNITINGSGIASSIIRCTADPNNGGFTISSCDSIIISFLSIHDCKLEQNNTFCINDGNFQPKWSALTL
jgi:pectate lyase